MDYVKIDKTSFRQFLADHGTNATKLARENKVCSERTFNNAMKNGYISEKIAEKIAKALGVNVEDFTEQEPYPVINKKKAKKEKPFMELTRGQFDETFDKLWNEANKDGYDKGYINGLALAMAYIYKHVEDLAVKSNNYDIISNFNYAFEKAKERIAAEKRQA